LSDSSTVPESRSAEVLHHTRLGTYCWVVEAAFACLLNYRGLRVRYEKRDDIREAFLKIGCLLICWNRVFEFC